jgi:hypothetical protein
LKNGRPAFIETPKFLPLASVFTANPKNYGPFPAAYGLVDGAAS